MPTLQDYRKRKYKTIKAFSEAYQCSPSKASGILRGLYHMTLSKDEVEHIARVLEISFIACADACDDTYAELKKYKGDAWKHTPRTHKGIWERWRYEEEIYRDALHAAKNGDWSEYRKKYEFNYNDDARSQTTASTRETCFTVLGIPTHATPEQIKKAFRDKVRAFSDGKGGYVGDMDKLVTAKEQALASVQVKA